MEVSTTEYQTQVHPKEESGPCATCGWCGGADYLHDSPSETGWISTVDTIESLQLLVE
jgi:hypothetical protein